MSVFELSQVKVNVLEMNAKKSRVRWYSMENVYSNRNN